MGISPVATLALIIFSRKMPIYGKASFNNLGNTPSNPGVLYDGKVPTAQPIRSLVTTLCANDQFGWIRVISVSIDSLDTGQMTEELSVDTKKSNLHPESVPKQELVKFRHQSLCMFRRVSSKHQVY